MKIVGRTGREDIAYVYLAEMRKDRYVEFVESVQPPIPREKKWVIIVSTLFGCPVGCKICDAGGWYQGKLSGDEIFQQIDYLVTRRYPDRKIPAGKFKVQFARMGEPSLNSEVPEVLTELPTRYEAPGLMACISTIAPSGTEEFFDKLAKIKERCYANGKFQMQFSIHSTQVEIRDHIIPIRKWDFAQIAEYGERFYQKGDRRIALNFALAENVPVNPDILSDFFDPEIFVIKLTPVNPTFSAMQNRISNRLQTNIGDNVSHLVSSLKEKGFDVIISIGELEENRIGSNCGQYVRNFLTCESKIEMASKELAAYEYEILSC